MDVISTSTMESNIAHATDGIMKCIAKFMNQCMTKLSFSVLSGGVDIFDEFACHANNAVDGYVFLSVTLHSCTSPTSSIYATVVDPSMLSMRTGPRRA